MEASGHLSSLDACKNLSVEAANRPLPDVCKNNYAETNNQLILHTTNFASVPLLGIIRIIQS
jgi:hypothetical protein